MKQKIKIMQIIPDLGLGGAEIMVENLATELIKEGYELEILSLYSHVSPITERMKELNITINYMDKKPGFDWKIIFRMYKKMKKFKPDVVNTHLYSLPYGIFAAVFVGVPVRIHTIHSIATKEGNKLRRKISKYLYKHCDVLPVSISPLVKETVLKEYNLKETVPMIYNGIDLKKCIPKTSYKSKEKKINIIHIGSFKEAKNQIGLIESFRIVCDKFPKTILTLIGEGELKEQINNRVHELKLDKNIVLLGLKDNVYPFLNAADIFILPSLWEGMPISLIEAMATGLPIVATRVGGIPDMIEDNVSGLLTGVNINEISAALFRLIQDVEFREKLGKEAKIAAERFDSKKMAKGYAELYESNYNKKMQTELR